MTPATSQSYSAASDSTIRPILPWPTRTILTKSSPPRRTRRTPRTARTRRKTVAWWSAYSSCLRERLRLEKRLVQALHRLRHVRVPHHERDVAPAGRLRDEPQRNPLQRRHR